MKKKNHTRHDVCIQSKSQPPTLSTTLPTKQGERREKYHGKITFVLIFPVAALFIIGGVSVDCGFCVWWWWLTESGKKLVQKFTTHSSELLFYIWSLHVFCPHFVPFVFFFFYFSVGLKNCERALPSVCEEERGRKKVLVTFILFTSVYLSDGWA